MLAFPLALANSGWVGVLLLAIFTVSTRYTAYLIGKIMEEHPDCYTFSDMGKGLDLGLVIVGAPLLTFKVLNSRTGRKAFGMKGSALITVIFFLVSLNSKQCSTVIFNIMPGNFTGTHAGCLYGISSKLCFTMPLLAYVDSSSIYLFRRLFSLKIYTSCFQESP